MNSEMFVGFNWYEFGAYNRQDTLRETSDALDKTHHARPGGIKPNEHIKVKPSCVVERSFLPFERDKGTHGSPSPGTCCNIRRYPPQQNSMPDIESPHDNQNCGMRKVVKGSSRSVHPPLHIER